MAKQGWKSTAFSLQTFLEIEVSVLLFSPFRLKLISTSSHLEGLQKGLLTTESVLELWNLSIKTTSGWVRPPGFKWLREIWTDNMRVKYFSLVGHVTLGHQGRGATYRWIQDHELDLNMDTIAEVIHECETYAVIRQTKQIKSFWYEGWWLKFKSEQVWQKDYLTLPQTCLSKCCVLTIMEATTE